MEAPPSVSEPVGTDVTTAVPFSPFSTHPRDNVGSVAQSEKSALRNCQVVRYRLAVESASRKIRSPRRQMYS